MVRFRYSGLLVNVHVLLEWVGVDAVPQVAVDPRVVLPCIFLEVVWNRVV